MWVKLRGGFSLILRLAMMGCASVSPGGSRYHHYYHHSQHSHECIFQPLIARFKTRYAAFLGFKLARRFSQTSSCVQTVVTSSWRWVIQLLPPCSSGCVSCCARPANLQLLQRTWASEMRFKWMLRIISQSGVTERLIIQLVMLLWLCLILCKALCECICLFLYFINVIMLWKHFLWMPFRSGWSAWTHSWTCAVFGDGLAEFMGKSWTEHLLVSRQTTVRAFKCRDRKRWRPFLFI